MVDDQVQISISSTSPEAAQFFNLTPATVGTTGTMGIATPSATIMSVYSVSAHGNITLPVLGDMQVLGLTSEELKQKVYTALTPYLKDAVVSVKIVNFKVTVIGEVTRPVVVPVNGERLNVLEAIGAAGDMTPYSYRFNVKVLRKTADGTEVGHLNFNTSNMLLSPFYQLRQNDVVYVEPNKNKAFSETVPTIQRLVAIVTTAVVLIITISSRFK